MEIFESHSIGWQPEIFMKFEFRAEHSKFQQFRRKQNYGNIGYRVFKFGDSKLGRYLPKSEKTQRK